MSYEGYQRLLCANGHLRQFDVYADALESTCDCGAAFAWWNAVDCTNDDGEQFIIPLEVKTPAVTCTCHCGNAHVVKEAEYVIPRASKAVAQKRAKKGGKK